MTIKTCLNCVNVESSIGGCKLKLDTIESDDGGMGIPMGQYLAKDCSQYCQDDELEKLEKNEYDLLTDSLRLRGMGLLDKDFMPTDEFFEWV